MYGISNIIRACQALNSNQRVYCFSMLQENFPEEFNQARSNSRHNQNLKCWTTPNNQSVVRNIPRIGAFGPVRAIGGSKIRFGVRNLKNAAGPPSVGVKSSVVRVTPLALPTRKNKESLKPGPKGSDKGLGEDPNQVKKNQNKVKKKLKRDKKFKEDTQDHKNENRTREELIRAKKYIQKLENIISVERSRKNKQKHKKLPKQDQTSSQEEKNFQDLEKKVKEYSEFYENQQDILERISELAKTGKDVRASYQVLFGLRDIYDPEINSEEKETEKQSSPARLSHGNLLDCFTSVFYRIEDLINSYENTLSKKNKNFKKRVKILQNDLKASQEEFENYKTSAKDNESSELQATKSQAKTLNIELKKLIKTLDETIEASKKKDAIINQSQESILSLEEEVVNLKETLEIVGNISDKRRDERDELKAQSNKLEKQLSREKVKLEETGKISRQRQEEIDCKTALILKLQKDLVKISKSAEESSELQRLETELARIRDQLLIAQSQLRNSKNEGKIFVEKMGEKDQKIQKIEKKLEISEVEINELSSEKKLLRQALDRALNDRQEINDLKSKLGMLPPKDNEHTVQNKQKKISQQELEQFYDILKKIEKASEILESQSNKKNDDYGKLKLLYLVDHMIAGLAEPHLSNLQKEVQSVHESLVETQRLISDERIELIRLRSERSDYMRREGAFRRKTGPFEGKAQDKRDDA